MKYNPEILAPVGNFEMLEAAIKAGATGVYLGGTLYSARAFAKNFDNEGLSNAIDFCHKRGVKVYVTVNTLFHDYEIENALNFVIDLYNMDVDGVIIQDLGLFMLIREHVPEMPVHASTQMNINNFYGAKLLQELGFKRVVLARETPYNEIKKICNELDIEVEVFVHGSLCVSCSGQCLMSSYIGNRSGNRGRCAQPCRMNYKLLDNSKREIKSRYGLNSYISPKDLSTIENIELLKNIGVHSFKIEGRMKKPEYVYNVVKSYNDKINSKNYDENRLKEVGLRGHTKGLIFSDFGKSYVELDRRVGKKGIIVGEVIEKNNRKHIKFNLPVYKNDILLLETKKNKLIPYTLKNDFNIGEYVSENYFHDLNISSNVIRSSFSKLQKEISDIDLNLKREVDIKFIGKLGEKPLLKIIYNDVIFSKEADFVITNAKKSPMTVEDISNSIDKLGNTDYYARSIKISIDDNIFIPVKILKELRRDLISKLDLSFSNYHKRKKLKNINLNSITKNKNYNKKIKLNIEYLKTGNLSKNLGCDTYFSEISENLINNFYKINRIMFYKDFKGLKINLKDINFKGFLINNLGDIQFIKENFPNKIIVGDYGMNILNIYAFKFLKSLGLNRITLSTELNVDEINHILQYVDTDYEIIVHGPLLSMTMVHCPFSVLKNCKNGNECKNCIFNKGFLENQNHEKFKVIRKQGYSELYHSKELLGYPFLDKIKFTSGGSIRLIICEDIEIQKIYYNKINETNKKEHIFNLSNYTYGHFEKGIE